MKVAELFESSLNEGFAIKLKDGSWYSEEKPTLGPVAGGNSQVVTFKTKASADDFLVMQQNKKGSSRKFEDAEIKRAPNPKAVKEETLTEKTKGSWKVANLSGVEKTFKSNDLGELDSKEARAWMKNHGDAKQIWNGSSWVVDPKVTDREIKKQDREWAKQDREDAKAEKKPVVDLKKVYDIVMDAIGNTFPDGDPFDHYAPKIRKLGVKEYDVGDVVAQAMKKHGHGIEKKGTHAYMAQMWDEMTRDAMHDAKNAKDGRFDSPFVDMEDGKPVAKSNPWK